MRIIDSKAVIDLQKDLLKKNIEMFYNGINENSSKFRR